MARARVQHIPVLKEVKGALLEFADSIKSVMATVDADVGRVTQWLNQERPAHWKGEIRRREDAVGRARQEIERKRLIAAPEPPSLALEQRALERAKERLASAQRRQEAVRKWAPQWERQALMYKSSCHGLSDSVNAQVPAAAARLERMLRALEEYSRLAVPTKEGDVIDLPEEGGEGGESEAARQRDSETGEKPGGGGGGAGAGGAA
ncbi:MAG: hypothetical protein WD749_05205 [Phycisphaerales bacterium]